MPPVADLQRIGQRATDRLGIGARRVPAHDLDAGMLTQPRLQRLGPAVGQHVDAFTGLGVDQDRGVPVAAAQGKVIHTEHPRHPSCRQRQPQQRAQRGMPGDEHAQPG